MSSHLDSTIFRPLPFVGPTLLLYGLIAAGELLGDALHRVVAQVLDEPRAVRRGLDPPELADELFGLPHHLLVLEGDGVEVNPHANTGCTRRRDERDGRDDLAQEGHDQHRGSYEGDERHEACERRKAVEGLVVDRKVFIVRRQHGMIPFL